MDPSINSSPGLQERFALTRALGELRDTLVQRAERHRGLLMQLPPDRHASGENLLHYLALRDQDLRPLQLRLYRLGLSSLGRAEPHVLASVDAVLSNVGEPGPEMKGCGTAGQARQGFDDNRHRLEQNTLNLFGPSPEGRRVYIMVTLPTQAAEDYLLVEQLLVSGTDCVRINCAHDGPETWKWMIENVRNAQRATGRSCRVLMDLAGPKLRTGPMAACPGVIKVKPDRSSLGEVERPAQVWLYPGGSANAEPHATTGSLAVEADWLKQAREGDRVRFRDARGSKRSWRIRQVTPDGCLAEGRKTAYLVNGVTLRLRRADDREQPVTELASIPPGEAVIRVRVGDTLLVSGDGQPGQAELRDKDGNLLRSGRVSLGIAEVYRDARTGESIHFDDGRITGIIQSVDDGQLMVRIHQTRKSEERLTSDRGVNFPDSDLDLEPLGERDLEHLAFVAQHADMVGLSFVNSGKDVRDLRERLVAMGAGQLALVAKIETRRGFEQLPGILLEALQFPVCGVMIARGDLAVECGFERLAEIQEEIMWFCEAAHVPVIWATQVLESLCKRGLASRAEIADAAMSQAAECVMLNKGPYVDQAVIMLDDILRRMQFHRSKKRARLCRLGLGAWSPDTP
jgi:pyruvate kinase